MPDKVFISHLIQVLTQFAVLNDLLQDTNCMYVLTCKSMICNSICYSQSTSGMPPIVFNATGKVASNEFDSRFHREKNLYLSIAILVSCRSAMHIGTAQCDAYRWIQGGKDSKLHHLSLLYGASV